MTDAICITFDVDWAPDEALEDVLELLERAGAAATFFATHGTAVLGSSVQPRTEVGVHPDFRDAQEDMEAPVRRLLELYPRARGVRSHLLYQSSPLLEVFKDLGFDYESNTHLPFHPGLRPFIRIPGLVSIPYSWSDDTHFRLGKPLQREVLMLDRPGVKVIAFHPIHIFANTLGTAHYERAVRPHYSKPNELLRTRDVTAPGVRTLFEGVLAFIVETRVRTLTLSEVCEGFRASLTGDSA